MLESFRNKRVKEDFTDFVIIGTRQLSLAPFIAMVRNDCDPSGVPTYAHITPVTTSRLLSHWNSRWGFLSESPKQEDKWIQHRRRQAVPHTINIISEYVIHRVRSPRVQLLFGWEPNSLESVAEGCQILHASHASKGAFFAKIVKEQQPFLFYILSFADKRILALSTPSRPGFHYLDEVPGKQEGTVFGDAMKSWTAGQR